MGMLRLDRLTFSLSRKWDFKWAVLLGALLDQKMFTFGNFHRVFSEYGNKLGGQAGGLSYEHDPIVRIE